ncbi:unnamed protein product [Bursaphelenchus xylophilus]|nr:unnamed protein product [Bursaphelenchus xylophilus]CAG9113203.1 unnamed protein product [Bursaphelenchus xylophilus]
MLVTNATVDLLYAINTLCTFCTAAFGYKAVFMLIDNPYWPKTVWWTYAGLCTNLFFMFLSVGMLPLQFIYRYGVMRTKAFTRKQMFGFFCVALGFATMHGFASPWTFTPPSAEWEPTIREALSLGEDADLPGYVVGDVREFGVMALHFIDIFVIMFLSYAVIIIMVVLSKHTITMDEVAAASPLTKAVQRQVTRIIYVQAIYPLFVICAPCLAFPILALKGAEVKFFGEWAMLSMHTPPLVNSLSVILCVPSYRRVVTHPFTAAKVRSLRVETRRLTALQKEKLLRCFHGTKTTFPQLHPSITAPISSNHAT